MQNLESFGVIVCLVVFFELAVQELFIKFAKKPLKKNYRYHVFQNLSVFSIPIAGLLFLVFKESWPIVKLFLFSAFVGTALEYLAGKVLFHLHGSSIWEYQYLPLGKYTSYVAFFYWGGVGLLVFKLASILDLVK